MTLDDGSTHPTTAILTRFLQDQTGEGLVRNILAAILGLVGLVATVALTYVVALLCDTTVRIFSPFQQPETENASHQGLDRARIETSVQKRIVKELFANETFLYSSKKATAKEGVISKKGDDEESGIQLQEMSLKDKDTTETDEESTASPTKQPVGERTSDAATNTDEQDSEMFSSSEPACCICLAPYREGESILRSKHCTHMFHSACCEDWILQKPVCPLCAKPMILDAEWEATAASVLGEEQYNAMLLEQREERAGEMNHSSSV